LALVGALWLLGLYAAAPVLRSSSAYSFADRLRDALILGVAITFVLGFANVLYPATLWIALAICLGVAYYRGTLRPANTLHTCAGSGIPYILIAVIAAIAWPPVMRPLLDGDSISYHLPNAAAWSHANGVWTTDPRYWWYPPASELFAGALYTVAGPLSLPWCGLGALMLLGFRLYGWAREEFGVSPLLADTLAAATVTAAPIALQAATLQNDVWLAAFVVDILWCSRRGDARASARSLAITALLKPYGFLFAAACAIANRLPARVWTGAAAIVVLWGVHDALLWQGAIVPPQSTSYGNNLQSTIVAHGAPALALLVKVTFIASPFAIVALIAALLGPLLVKKSRDLGWMACFAIIFYLIMPLAYEGPGPQLASGASLRYAAPAIALGALVLTPWFSRLSSVASVVLSLCAFFGVAHSVALYRYDAPTLLALPIALCAVIIVGSAVRARTTWPIVCGVAVAIVASALLAARFPADYYDDALHYHGRSTFAYDWLAQFQPPGVGGTGLRLGVVNVLSPQTRTVDLPDTTPCATARVQGVLLVAIAEPDRSDAFNEARLRAARACGRTLYRDGIAVISLP
jgi:hypothetical protein